MACQAALSVPALKRLAVGWRMLSVLGITYLVGSVATGYNGYLYSPLLTAYLRKYKTVSKNDTFEIKDRTREYYEIDDSQYMAYTEEDLKHEHMHANHGPQPEAMDSSFMVERDLWLQGKPSAMTEHPRFLKYPYEYMDKSFPT